MGLLEDINKTLERIPGWKRVIAAPDEIDALKKRVEALESKLAPATGEQCPICRAPQFKIIASAPHPDFGFAGTKMDTLQCQACGHSEQRMRD